MAKYVGKFKERWLLLCILLIAGVFADAGGQITFEDVIGGEKAAWDLIKESIAEVDEIAGGKFPHVTENSKWQLSDDGNWTGGFFPGILWLIAKEAYQRGDPDAENWRLKAEVWTERLAPRIDDNSTHDLGFLFVPSWVEACKQTGAEKWRLGALQAAWSLAERFAPGGFIQSWGPIGKGRYAGTVIIDNMMNLELLYWAAIEGNFPQLGQMANSHAFLTFSHHIRADGSTFHLVDFSRDTGEAVSFRTHQGLRANSTWSRGQAWAIAGFAMAYRYTQIPEFAEAVIAAGQYFMDHLPEDKVAPWDFAAGPQAAKDTSANAIAAVGFLDFAKVLAAMGEEELAREYAQKARELLSALHPYSIFTSEEHESQDGLLTGGTYAFPRGEAIEECLIWGDYYYLKGLLELMEWNRKKSD